MVESIAEVGKLAGVCGDYAGDWIRLTAALDGSLKIVLGGPTGEMPVFQLAPGRMTVAQHQYDGETWRKSNLLFGYNDRWNEDLGGTAGAASYSKGTSSIPANEAWILQGVSIRNISRAITSLTVYIYLSTGGYVVMADLRPAPASQPCFATGQFVLRIGDAALVEAQGCTIGDTIQAGVIGYKMMLDM